MFSMYRIPRLIRAQALRCNSTKGPKDDKSVNPGIPQGVLDALNYTLRSTPSTPKTGWSTLDTSRLLPTSNRNLPSTKTGPFVAYQGRTKQVRNGDIATAFKELNSTIRINAVARDYKKQKFYEKPSDLRNRLSRERHRRRFLSGVKRLVGLVKQTRKQFAL